MPGNLLYNDDANTVKPHSNNGGGIAVGTIPANGITVESVGEMIDTSRTYYCMDVYWMYNGTAWLAYGFDTGEEIASAYSGAKAISADKINFTGLVDFDKRISNGETSI